MLYRKYRSQNFSELIGQDNIVRVLKQSILENRLGHAYLFSGPRGTGKTSTARILAKAINCSNSQEGEPCNKCANCKAIQAGKFLDLIEIDAASNRGIEEIRALKEKIGFLPVEGKYKVYIIDEVHMLTGEAFNALLKTLEEPPENVIIILATTEAHKLPATILSRVQRFDFKLASDTDLIKKLERIINEEGFEFEKEALELIAQGGMGSFRDSETLLDKAISGLTKGSKLLKNGVEGILGYTGSGTMKEFLDALINGQASVALKIFDAIFEGGANLLQFVKQVLEYSRNSIVKSIEAGNISETKEYMRIIKEFNGISSEIKFALLPRVLIEMAILNLVSDRAENVVVSGQPRVQKLEKIGKVEKIEKEPEVTVDIDIEKIKSKWVNVIAESKSHNHHLVAMLSNAKVGISKNGMLEIIVPYAFHKSRLSESETKRVIQEIFKKVFGQEIAYQCVVDKSLSDGAKNQKSKGNEGLVEDILK